jgi:hypothetical protein
MGEGLLIVHILAAATWLGAGGSVGFSTPRLRKAGDETGSAFMYAYDGGSWYSSQRGSWYCSAVYCSSLTVRGYLKTPSSRSVLSWF